MDILNTIAPGIAISIIIILFVLLISIWLYILKCGHKNRGELVVLVVFTILFLCGIGCAILFGFNALVGWNPHTWLWVRKLRQTAEIPSLDYPHWWVCTKNPLVQKNRIAGKKSSMSHFLRGKWLFLTWRCGQGVCGRDFLSFKGGQEVLSCVFTHTL